MSGIVRKIKIARDNTAQRTLASTGDNFTTYLNGYLVLGTEAHSRRTEAIPPELHLQMHHPSTKYIYI
jgi:hypothetical protein